MSAKPTTLTGRIWIIGQADGSMIDDIDTDMIFHNSHLHITELAKMGQHAFGNLEGWQDFPQKARKGDILILGKNFGAGSSRQQAVDCFTALGIQALVAESFGAIYKRNAINAGMPILWQEGLISEHDPDILSTGDTVTLDLAMHSLRCHRTDQTIVLTPFSRVQMDIYQAGNLFAFGKAAATTA